VTSPTPLPEPLRSFAATTLRVSKLLGQASSIQWSPAPVARPSDDTTERSKGGHSDPTVATVFDDRRLAVRAAVLTAEDALRTSRLVLEEAKRTLETAVDRWSGD